MLLKHGVLELVLIDFLLITLWYLKDTCSLDEKLTKLGSILKSRDITLLTKFHIVSYGFSSSHVQMWELDHKEGWVMKNWWFWTVGWRRLESPLDCKEIQPVHPKGNQSWIFTGRTDAETQILWPPEAKSQLIGKDPDAGKDWGQKEKGMTKDETVGWHHWLNGHESEQTLGDSEGQGSLACCSPWCLKELDTTEQLNWTDSSFLRICFK